MGSHRGNTAKAAVAPGAPEALHPELAGGYSDLNDYL